VFYIACPLQPAAAEDALNVVSWGGAYQTSQTEAFFKPFIKDTGTKLTEENYNGEVAKIRAMVEANSVTWDVIDADTPTMMAACAEGTLGSSTGMFGLIARSSSAATQRLRCPEHPLLHGLVDTENSGRSWLTDV
jgi:hypothetical protein